MSIDMVDASRSKILARDLAWSSHRFSATELFPIRSKNLFSHALENLQVFNTTAHCATNTKMGTGKKEANRKIRQGKVGDGMANVKTKGENFYRSAKKVKRGKLDTMQRERLRRLLHISLDKFLKLGLSRIEKSVFHFLSSYSDTDFSVVVY
jgi:hypothetical protein